MNKKGYPTLHRSCKQSHKKKSTSPRLSSKQLKEAIRLKHKKAASPHKKKASPPKKKASPPHKKATSHKKKATSHKKKATSHKKK